MSKVWDTWLNNVWNIIETQVQYNIMDGWLMDDMFIVEEDTFTDTLQISVNYR